ncbi:hypothetical protein GW777_05310 [Candidatus Peregrinibacteria bacterium]|nr:hypothetical protein [Candidatus Peregrinibacteria bacterium]
MALVVAAVAGALLVDLSAGTRSLFLTFMWALSRISLLFAAIALFSGLYPKKPLSLTPKNLTILVGLAFVLALVVDPLLSLIAVIYHVLRLRGPAISVVAATVSALLGSAVFMGFGPFGSFVQASLASPLGMRWLWNQNQVWLVLVTSQILVMIFHFTWATKWAKQKGVNPKNPTNFRAAFRLRNLPGATWVLGGFVLLVVAQYTLPDVHDRLAEAVWNTLQGKSYRIREEWWELIPWRECVYMGIGLAAYIICRPAQQKNNFSYRPVLAAAWVMFLLHLAMAPFLTVLFEQRNEWPTLIRVAYELLGWIRTQLPERWMFQLCALAIVALLGLIPSFPALALIAHDRRISGGDDVRKKGKVVRMTPFGAIRRAALIFLPALLISSIITHFILG